MKKTKINSLERKKINQSDVFEQYGAKEYYKDKFSNTES
jgi:hypothetical protein